MPIRIDLSPMLGPRAALVELRGLPLKYHLSGGAALGDTAFLRHLTFLLDELLKLET